MRVPLAWLSLLHSKRRLLVSIAGIAGAVVIMFLEFGFLNSLLDSQVELLARLDADLVLSSPIKYAFAMNVPFPRRRLYQARAVDGVESAWPVYVEMSAMWRNPADGRARTIRALAFDPDHPVFRDADIERVRPALKQADTAVFDVKSRAHFGTIEPGTRTELSKHIVRVVGLFALGTDFVNDGTVVMSEVNFARFFPKRATADGEVESMELGVVRLRPGADLAAVRRALQAALPADVAVLTREELVTAERGYWQTAAPVGYVFGVGAALGFAIGAMICYQILFTEVTDHLPQFATLKAIGYGSRFVIGVVMREALVLSLLGFVPGLAVSHALFQWLADATGLPLRLTVGRVAVVLVLTVMMTVPAGLVAVRPAVAADPADVFA